MFIITKCSGMVRRLFRNSIFLLRIPWNQINSIYYKYLYLFSLKYLNQLDLTYLSI